MERARATRCANAASEKVVANVKALSAVHLPTAEVADGLVVEAAVETWQRESARLLGVRRSAGLVEEALRGRRFVARL